MAACLPRFNEVIGDPSPGNAAPAGAAGTARWVQVTWPRLGTIQMNRKGDLPAFLN